MSFSEQRTESTVVELCRDLRKLEQEVGELRRQVAAHENELGRLLKAAGSRRSSRTSEVDQRLARVLELLRSGGTWVAIVALTAAFVLSATRTGEPQLQRVELRGDWVCRRR